MITTLLIATGNRGKIAEIRRVLDLPGLRLVTPADLDLTVDVDEAGATYAENAVLKAEAYAAAAGMPALADDSGLEVDALDGRPGVHSARYGGPGLDDAGRRAFLLTELKDVPQGRRTARFRALVAVGGDGMPVQLFEGVVEGAIALAERGEGGFGYDPVFELPDGRTAAQLAPGEKDGISHRGIAVRAAREWLASRVTAGD